MTDASQPIAGWYPDPENAAAERWWDGTTWSDHRRPSTVPAAPATPAAAPEIPAAPVEAQAEAPAAFVPPVEAPTAFVPPAAPPVAPPVAAPAPMPAYGAYATPGSAAPGYVAPAYTPAQPANGIAVIGLVLALGGLIVSFGGLTSLAGAIISCFALSRASKMRRQGVPNDRYGMALAGIISGFAIFVLVVAGLVTFFVFVANNPDFGTTDFG